MFALVGVSMELRALPVGLRFAKIVFLPGAKNVEESVFYGLF